MYYPNLLLGRLKRIMNYFRKSMSRPKFEFWNHLNMMLESKPLNHNIWREDLLALLFS
jgi:hypothetical protein